MALCPACGSASPRFAFKLHYWREHLLEFKECRACRTQFCDPMPSTEVIRRGNDALVKRGLAGKSFETEFREARQAYLRGRLLGTRLKRLAPRGRLLELGCGSGFLLRGVADACGWEVEGLEISRTLASFCEKRLGVRCHEGTLEATTLRPASYDFILCHDLIEHINEPATFLAQIGRVLSPGGRLEIITPNGIQDLVFAKRAYAQGTPMTMLLNHILLFSPGGLRAALHGAGLQVESLYCYDLRHVLKDFGVFGMNKPERFGPGPSMEESPAEQALNPLEHWTPAKIDELRRHPKTRGWYGFVRETLPDWLTLPVPAKWGIGHEIYALATKAQ